MPLHDAVVTTVERVQLVNFKGQVSSILAKGSQRSGQLMDYGCALG